MVNLVSGPIGRNFIRFALPLLAISFVQQLYGTVDLLFVGNVLGNTAYAAIGASSLIVSCLINLMLGISLGIGVMVAQAHGANKPGKMRTAFSTGFWFVGILGVVIACLGAFFAPQILALMQTPQEILEPAVTYIRIYFVTFVPLCIYDAGAAVLRSTGDSVHPLIAQIVGGLSNIFVDWFALCVLNGGIEGIAWATFFSHMVATVVILFFVFRAKSENGERFFPIGALRQRIDARMLGDIVKVGLPAGLQSAAITLSNIFIQAAVNTFGTFYISAFASYLKVELLLFYPVLALGQALTTFVAQNYGARNMDRVKKGLAFCIASGVVVCVVGALVLVPFGAPVFALLNPNPQVVSCGMLMISVCFPFYWIYVFLESFSSTMRGLGNSFLPMVIALVCQFALRSVVLFAGLAFWNDIHWVFITFVITWACMAVSTGVACSVVLRKRFREVKRIVEAGQTSMVID